jgi:uncharacterized DUF497 family protein
VDFRWNDWNVEHIARHGVGPAEAEQVIRAARAPYPRKIDGEKWLVWGRGRGERFLQVVFVLDPDDAVYVIHARPLTGQEKRRYRRRDRR